MNNIGRIIELLTILTSTLEPSRGFETRESEFERHQQTKHRALGRASPAAGRAGHPSSIEDKAHPRQAPPRIRYSAAASRAVTIPGRGNLEKWRTCPVLSAS
jgi:hypothetical protein